MAVVPVVEPHTPTHLHRIRPVTRAVVIPLGAGGVRAVTQAVVILPQRVEVIRAAAHPVLRRTTAAEHRISRKVIAERCQL
jgi:hypothetical protein